MGKKHFGGLVIGAGFGRLTTAAAGRRYDVDRVGLLELCTPRKNLLWTDIPVRTV